LLDAVAVNRHTCRLIFTTDTEDKAAEINLLTERSGLPADVQVVGNRGRDIGPFLQVLTEIGDQYDIIGHVHGKRSLTTENVASDFGERWGDFLWQHLLGDSVPMMDRIMREFAQDSR
ncbi:rhamnan synthesis F family protein, partial [Bacillus sp. SIMBA_006]|uniref:rhamnan synthesis F family protein n=1 Tax=Bacillus sp. SIMBA_006 TaxID=3085755 RepID=UPI00397C09F5